MASGQPFASRSYAGTKLPDRSANPNAMPFSGSSFSRHRGLGASAPTEFGNADGPKQPQQAAAPAAAAQPHGPAQESNPLNRLTEEQREEINEAVRIVLALPLVTRVSEDNLQKTERENPDEMKS